MKRFWRRALFDIALARADGVKYRKYIAIFMRWLEKAQSAPGVVSDAD